MSNNKDKENVENKENIDVTSSLKITKAVLKKIIIKRGKIKRCLFNYGSNVDEHAKYFISENNSKKFIEEHKEKKEKEVKNKGIKVKSTTNKKKWLNFSYFALNIVVIAIVLGVQLSKEDNPVESLTAILEINWWFILGAFGLFLLCMVLDQIKFAFLIHKATGVFRFRLAYKVVALGRHYDVVTPLSTGGQPFQMFYMNKYGVNAGESISIAMGKYIFSQIVFFSFITFILFRNIITHSLDFVGNVASGLVSTLSWIGYGCTAVLIITVVFISLNRRAGTGFVVGILKLLSKIRIGKFKIIKNYKKTFVKVMRTVNVWQTTTKKYSKSFWVVFVNILSSIFYYLSIYSIPYFIYCAFAGWDPSSWMLIMTIAVMVDLSSAFNPLPMGVGTADLSFTVLYGMFFASIPGAQIWALIIWRILNYYIYIVQGLFVLTYDYAIGDRRLKKYKEYWMLPYKKRMKLKNKKEI